MACPLEGYWKSNEPKTLESMRRAIDLPEKARKLFENNFFGKLHAHIECNRFTTVLDGEVQSSEYEIIRLESNVYRLKSYSEILGDIEQTLRVEGACYSLEISQGKFREYFCPITVEAYNE